MDIDERYKPFKKDNGKWTYKDTETGKLLDFECKFCSHIYGIVKLDDVKSTYFSVKTGKLLDAEFNNISRIRHGYGRVQLDDDKWTYFNAKTDKLLDERFIFALNAESYGRVVVELDDGKWYIFNPETREYSQEVKFDYVNGFYDGYALGEIDGKGVIYNVIDNEKFDGEGYSNLNNGGIVEAIQKYPENFLKLNVYSFGDSDEIRKYLNAARKGLFERLEAINPNGELVDEEIAKNNALIEKIKKFCKSKVAEYKAIQEKEKANKEKIANAKDKINKLGNMLNLDDEERNDD